jgi:hypothetical protein
MVRRCLDDKLCLNLQNYFEINEHTINTRNQNKLLKLPRVKLEFGRKSFRYQGAKCFNELPILARESEASIQQYFKEQ